MGAQLYIITFVVVGVIISSISFSVFYKQYKNRIKSDISLEQMKSLEDNLNLFLQQNKLTVGVDIFEIAKVLKVKSGEEKEDLVDEAKLTDPDKDGNRVVLYKSDLTDTAKRFNFAHECAHLINKDAMPATRPSGLNKPLVEQLADYTAAALLMPIEQVHSYLEDKKYNSLSSKKRLIVVNDLCEKYNVSEIIALRRIKEVYELQSINN